ncbi:MAG: caspase family protein, partial [Paracoccaceae bacterium]|nr:caspase family protein [Paracoccaceae bacterium]
DIAAALERLGFEVTLLTDAANEGFWDKIEAFSVEAETAESTVFFYSGHAFQMNGSNYLVPVNAKLTSRESIRTETWNLDGIIARLQDRNRQTLIFLDACRNDPLPASVRGSDTAADGLARLQTGVGTFVAFATEPGAVTYDGAGDAPNSPFTTALLEHIETPGISVSDMMIKVRNEVEERTLRRQTPWDQSSLREQFYFTPAVEKKQELSEADYELLAQLAPDDRKKFMDLLRASGFSDASLRAADAAIEVASLNLELAASDGGVSIGAAGSIGDPGQTTITTADAATTIAPPEPEEFVFELVDGGVTLGDAPALAPAPAAQETQIATALAAPPAQPPAAAPVQPSAQPAAQPAVQPSAQQPVAVAQAAPSQSIATVGETNLALLPQPDPISPLAPRTEGEKEPIRLAALTWETRGIIGINALTVERLRVEGTEVTPDNDENRTILASIDPRL